MRIDGPYNVLPPSDDSLLRIFLNSTYGRICGAPHIRPFEVQRPLYKRFVNRFIYANLTNTYNFMYSDIKQASGLLQQGREADNRKKLVSALNELIERGVLLKYDTDEQIEGRKIVDVKYTVTAAPDFISEQKAADKRRKDSEMQALGAGVSLVGN